MNNYKIAVYAICGNEIKNIDEWFKSMFDADYICVLDTGSTDGSYNKLLDYQNKYPDKVIIDRKTYDVWRFDVPRNDSMKLIPKDATICICTDLDERLTPGWAEKLRQLWRPGCERGYYLYAWSHLQNGDPARVFWYDKIHSNSGFWKWKYPVHEVLEHPLYGYHDLAEDQRCWMPSDFIMLHHYPTLKTTRSNYLSLLKLRAQEFPNEPYSLVYLAHEYKYQKQYQNCIDYITSTALSAASKITQDKELFEANLHMFRGDCYYLLGNTEKAISDFKIGIGINPLYRDNYIKLAKTYYELQQYQKAIDTINNCFAKSRHYYSWLETDTEWSWEPWDLLCVCYWKTGAHDMSYQCAMIAYNLDPSNPRLKENYEGLKQELEKHNCE